MISWSAEDPRHGVVRVDNGRSPLLLVELYENHPEEWVWGVWGMSSGLDAIATGYASNHDQARRRVEGKVRALLLEALGRNASRRGRA